MQWMDCYYRGRKIHTPNCYRRHVVILVSAKSTKKENLGEAYLSNLIIPCQSLANMILLTGVVFLGTYLKDEDLIKADNVYDVLYASTKLETV